MQRYLLIALISLGFSASALAVTPGPADVEAIANNLGPTVDALAHGLGHTANDMITGITTNGQPSAVQTSANLGNTLVSTGSALIAGAPNLAAAGLLPLVANSAIQQTLSPYLTAIDDPTSANIMAALAPNDLTTITQNLGDVPEAVVDGSGTSAFAPYGNGLRAAGVYLLEGQVSGLSNGAAIDAVSGVAFAVMKLVAGTNLQPAYPLVAVGGLGVLLATNGQLEQLDGPVGQIGGLITRPPNPIMTALKNGF